MVGLSDLRFQEIEHKFVVDDAFDIDAFRQALTTLQPTRTSSLQVRDTYYLLGGRHRGRFAIRHRYDVQLHHLTLKTFESDPEVRQEINLDLGHHAGDQGEAVAAFLAHLDVEWHGSLVKDLDVWYFPDAEVVHYRAASANEHVRCVEFEATDKRSLGHALETVRRYEQATGFDEARRSRRSLVEILFPDVASLLRAG